MYAHVADKISACVVVGVTAAQPDVHPHAQLQQVVQGLHEQVQDASQRQVLDELCAEAFKLIDLSV